ncbi:MAG: 16S rRNA (guanine(527)-N(7))-methyltransferase RsmG [Candidatus Rokubacteria bacterium]|nr:16S rRNA (guanine(527)-N(7))-methyltransferase RsmG [Candidatus Rokubacteria bacterium]
MQPSKHSKNNKLHGSWERARTDFLEVLSRGFNQILQRPPSPAEAEAFSRYLRLLLQWNRVQHLTSYRRPADIVEKLFLDSLLFLRWVPPGPARVLDLGAGAGIPGLPLKIVKPEITLTLVEARRRRVSFLTAVVRELCLEGVSVLEGRAEDLVEAASELRSAFDAVVTRAAAPLPSIFPVAMAFLRPGGWFIASGPPVGKALPRLPPDTPCRWESVSTHAKIGKRLFLLVEKAD